MVKAQSKFSSSAGETVPQRMHQYGWLIVENQNQFFEEIKRSHDTNLM